MDQSRVVKRKMSTFARKRGKPAPPSQQVVGFATTMQIQARAAPAYKIRNAPLSRETAGSVPYLIRTVLGRARLGRRSARRPRRSVRPTGFLAQQTGHAPSDRLAHPPRR
jgi:hypothetical protein